MQVRSLAVLALLDRPCNTETNPLLDQSYVLSLNACMTVQTPRCMVAARRRRRMPPPRERQRATEGAHAQVTVVLRNVFHPSEFEAEPTLHAELQADMLKECTKLGAVDKARRTHGRRPACCAHCWLRGWQGLWPRVAPAAVATSDNAYCSV